MTVQRSFPARRAALAAVAAIGLAAALSACGTTEKRPALACPDVRLDSDTVSLTKFRPGPGRDITDIVYEAEVTGFSGDCEFADDGSSVNLRIKVEFAVTEGPAMQGNTGEFSYFVAVPAYYPAEAAKQVLPVTFRFPDDSNVTTVRLRDEEVRIDIPLGPGVSPASTPVYVGFQLTPEELEYNRKRRRQ